jgi:hypothetical protein
MNSPSHNNLICGVEMPKRIWLLDEGSGDVTWCNDPDPSGDTAEAVEYVRADALPEQQDSDDALVERECRECDGSGDAEIIDGWARPCEACNGKGTQAFTETEAGLLDQIEAMSRQLVERTDALRECVRHLRPMASREERAAYERGHKTLEGSADDK